MKESNRLVMVCSECGTSSCWHGEFMCSMAKGANTELKTVQVLNAGGLENKDNYSTHKMIDVYGEAAPHGYCKYKHNAKLSGTALLPCQA